MSLHPLQSLLVEPDQSGAFYLTASDLGPLLEAAEGLGFRCVSVDLADCADKAALLRQLAAAFAFPPGFGLNWDSLSDALCDLSWLPAEGYVLGLESPGALREVCPDDFATLVAVLEGASLAWRDVGRPFWAFIALPDDEFDALAP
ncbi:barstar family protein [Arenimonas sp.]|uniref:barstar family protein n=1 Tax=Arenimonas sp. TaxID=1872635 RepID=UPI002E3813E7|nr:barstar family protein [Arenimonas sp.]HEX4853661.1 barstar family protein [Arenimonas sp.]